MILNTGGPLVSTEMLVKKLPTPWSHPRRIQSELPGLGPGDSHKQPQLMTTGRKGDCKMRIVSILRATCGQRTGKLACVQDEGRDNRTWNVTEI